MIGNIFNVMKSGMLLTYILLYFVLAVQAQAQSSQFSDDQVFVFSHYSNEQGLPSSYVKSIAQDQDGFIWFATRVSVCRFDGTNFQTFPAYNSKGEKSDLMCNNIFNLGDSLLICRTNAGEYYSFDFKNECFNPFSKLNDLGPTQSIEVGQKGFWVCRNNQIYFYDFVSEQLISLKDKLGIENVPPDLSFVDIKVKDNQLVGLTNNELVFWINLETLTQKIFEVPQSLRGVTISHLFLDHYKNLWMSEETRGLCCLNLDNGEINHFSKELKGNSFIPHNMIHSFGDDQQGRMWIGSEAGLLLWSPTFKRFSSIRYDPTNPTGLNTDPIYSVFSDRDGNLWLGTYFGGVNFWSGEMNFFRDWYSGLGRWQLGGKVVSCLTEDSQGNLWIGMEDMGLNKVNVKTGVVTQFTSSTKPCGLSYNNVHDLLFLDSRNLWIATYTGGINILNPETGGFKYVNTSNTSGLTSDNIYSFEKFRDCIFISSSNGITKYDIGTGIFSPFKPEALSGKLFESIASSGSRVWFSSAIGVYCYDSNLDSIALFEPFSELKNINFVKTDSKKRVWVGDCYKGLCYYDEATKKVEYFNSSNGFPVSWIFSLQEGNNGLMWASSDNGLVRFNPETKTFVLYNSNSGIPFNQFNYRASYQDRFGNIYFGGNNGMVSFNEDLNTEAKNNKNIVFTDFQLFNKSVAPGKKSPLNMSINQIEQLRLKYKENVFTIGYSALSYSTNGRCQYAYYLENFENEWNYVGNRNFATYTNLSPGTYYFHVKVVGNEVNDVLSERVLKIRISPPFWRSPWSLIIYLFAIWGISMILFLIGKRLEKSKALVIMERREKEHADEINKVKLEFFTNISHELKTPLTLILGPLSKILEEEKLSPQFKKRLVVIEKNSLRLFQLINQLLEFRKVDTGREKLQVTKGDIRQLAEEIKEAFGAIAESREVDFKVTFRNADILIFFDYNKLDKILYNLLSNAFKFTDKGGIVSLDLEIVKRSEKFRKVKQDLVITISDSGRGISPEVIDKVFERFFHFDGDSQQYQGSGIGLAYVQSLVLLHKGEIKVESELGKGSQFIVTIPVSINDYESFEVLSEPDQYADDEYGWRIEAQANNENVIIDALGFSHDPIVLLVEDNAELLEFMKETLENKYQVFTAKNGAEALSKIKGAIPDLIISDVMMPEMDGYEFTRIIKTDLNTSHIPVILLTAKSGAENRYKGLKTGADYYIEKPFYPNILEQNIENILNTRQKLIERFKNDAFVPISEIAHSESDKLFVEKLTALIKENISDPDLDVTFLIKELGMSRSLLHLKLKSLVDCSTTEFIRSIRLKEAVKLISSGKCNISEAAYETGFSSPTYFTRRFKEYFGKSPREYFNM